MSEFESSSGFSGDENPVVKEKFGKACILCGYPNFVDVVEILSDSTLLSRLQKWSCQLAGFQTDEVENLVCFCPNHHEEYKAGGFTIVPSPNVRQQMKEQEMRNFELRQQVINIGLPDPGRRLLMPPELPYEFEYVPITVPYYVQFHNETPLLPEAFPFSSQNIGLKEYPLRRWEVSVYAVLMAACEPLRDPGRLLSVRSDAAFNEVIELVDLYKRHTTTQVQESPGGAKAAGEEDEGEDVWQRCSMHTPSDGSYDLEREYTSTERPDLLGYDDEPAVTPVILSSRIRWTPAMSAYSNEGSMRFATSSDFVRDPGDLQED